LSAPPRPEAGAPPADLELVARYKVTGDPVHLGALFERYAHLVLAVSLRYLRNREDAEDAVLEIYERLSTTLLKHDVANFRSWLGAVVANHCRMTLRRRQREPSTAELSEEFLEAVLASAPAPRENSETEERLERLPAILAELGEDQRRCVELFYLRGHSYAEVARRSGYTLNEVKSHIQNGKRNLRIRLASRVS
jgi:RNA polymerase sigma factor (sigma-70 family)